MKSEREHKSRQLAKLTMLQNNHLEYNLVLFI